jgi:hypothetical protein
MTKPDFSTTKNLEKLRKDQEVKSYYKDRLQKIDEARRELVRRLISKTVRGSPRAVRERILEDLSDTEGAEND